MSDKEVPVLEVTSNRAVSVLEVVQKVQAAIAEDFGREKKNGNNILVVEKVEIELKTALTEQVGGKWEWKVITVDGNYAETQTQTLSLAWNRDQPQMKSFLKSDLGYQLITGLDALRIGAKEWKALSTGLPFKSSGGKLVFELAVNEDGSLAIAGFGGGVTSERTHTVTLTLAPLP